MAITKATASAIAPAAKGDLVVGSATNDAAVLGVGTNDQVLTADSSTATGLKWATAAAGGMTLISTTTLSGASISLSSIPQTYNDLRLVIRAFKPATDGQVLFIRFNGDSGANRHVGMGTSNQSNQAFNETKFTFGSSQDNTVATGLIIADIYDYTNTSTWKQIWALYYEVNNTTTTNFNASVNNGLYNQTNAISSIDLFPSSGNFTSGTALLYGVK